MFLNQGKMPKHRKIAQFNEVLEIKTIEDNEEQLANSREKIAAQAD